MKLAVLGVGLIGGSIGMAARRRLDAEVAGYDPSAETLEAAIANGAIDRAAASIAEACAGAGAVFCAAPVGALGQITREALAAAAEDCVVTDVGSTKRDIVAAVGEGEPRFVGGHPLAGAETAGVENARVDLFDGARWYLTPTSTTGGLLYDRLQRILAEIGARPQAIDAGEHDRAMATTSHLPHVVANVLARQAEGTLGEGERLPEVGPSLRDATRVAGANPAIWEDIFLANRTLVADAADAAAAALSEAAGILRSGSPEDVAAWHSAAGQARSRLLAAESTGGPVTELRVIVPNRPGIVAELALALGRGGVNIEDMALHPTADMSSGAVSLWIAGREEADRAAALVRDLGHAVQVQDAAG